MLYQDIYITVYILAVALILGLIFGSFVNCMAYRIAHGESVLKGRSHCTSCGHMLNVADLIPVFSYLFLRGKCRYCGEKFSPRYVITEIMMGIAFLFTVAKYDVSFISLRYMVLVCILMGLSLVDLEKFEIPDRFIAAGIIWWLVTIPLINLPMVDQLKDGLIGGVSIGMTMLIISLIFDKVTGKESLGGGDVKLFFVVGLYLGFAVSVFNLILSCVIGIVFVVVSKQKRIPFGPSISVATFISLLAGSDVVNWYLGLFL